MTPADRLPILRVSPDQVAPRVLAVGDPDRAQAAAALLQSVERIGANREYHTYSGKLDGEALTICSHGVGSAGAGVCFEELARAGARVILRAGTCGAIQDGIEDGDMIVASAAVRDEGLTPRLVPDGYPAVADHELVGELLAATAASGCRTHLGVVLSTDLFYPSQALGNDWQRWKASRVLAVEMELAPLYVIASLHGIRTGGLLAVDGNPTRVAQDMSEYDPYRQVVVESIETMLEVAIQALIRTRLES